MSAHASVVQPLVCFAVWRWAVSDFVSLLWRTKVLVVATDAFIPRRRKSTSKFAFSLALHYLCIIRGEKTSVQECVSCFILKIEIANFNRRGMRAVIRSFCLYTPCTAHAVPHKVYTTAWGICFSVHSLHGVWRYQIFDELDKSLRFSCIW